MPHLRLETRLIQGQKREVSKANASHPLWIHTIADPSQLDPNVRPLFNDIFFMGHREPRVALIGRSNVGKSSLVNALLGTKAAQISNTPGKTRALHFYKFPQAKSILVDLPGYGFSRRSQQEEKVWAQMIQTYLEQDIGLKRLLVLWDSRQGPTELDAQALDFLSFRRLPTTVVFTKVDQLKTQSDRARRLRETEDLRENFEAMFWVSAEKKTGMHELLRHLSQSQTSGEPHATS